MALRGEPLDRGIYRVPPMYLYVTHMNLVLRSSLTQTASSGTSWLRSPARYFTHYTKLQELRLFVVMVWPPESMYSPNQCKIPRVGSIFVASHRLSLWSLCMTSGC